MTNILQQQIDINKEVSLSTALIENNILSSATGYKIMFSHHRLTHIVKNTDWDITVMNDTQLTFLLTKTRVSGEKYFSESWTDAGVLWIAEHKKYFQAKYTEFNKYYYSDKINQIEALMIKNEDILEEIEGLSPISIINYTKDIPLYNEMYINQDTNGTREKVFNEVHNHGFHIYQGKFGILIY